MVDTNGGPTLGFELNEPPASDPCDVGWHPVGIDVDLAGPPPTTTEVTAVDVPKLVVQYPGDTDWYQLDFELSTGPGAQNTGTVDGSGHWVQDLTVEARLHQVDPGDGCDEDDLVCDVFGLLTLEGDHPDGPLSGSGIVDVGAPCTTPFDGWLGGAPFTVTDLELG